jgi:sugar phosphate isomerase/epimerase
MKIELGAILRITAEVDIRKCFREVAELGLRTCQVSCNAEHMIHKLIPEKIKKSSEDMGIIITSFFLTFEGQIYNRIEGISTVGFIPERLRNHRIHLAEQFSDLIYDLGIKSITSHVGFIPDDEKSPLYLRFIPIMIKFVDHCQKNGQIFCFETGQELPSTLKRTIKDIGDSAYVNFDPANLILYGMAHPLDAVEILGNYIKGMHAKDALWPNREEKLGIEVPVGKGEVNYPLLIPKLREKGFQGPITIEREITGEQQKKDILTTKTYLQPYL